MQSALSVFTVVSI